MPILRTFHYRSNAPVVSVDVASRQSRAHLGGAIKGGIRESAPQEAGPLDKVLMRV